MIISIQHVGKRLSLFLSACLLISATQCTAAQKAEPEAQKAPPNSAADPAREKSSDKQFEKTIGDTSQELLQEMKKLRTKQLYKSVQDSITAGDLPTAKAKLDKLIDTPDISKEERAVLYQERGLASVVLDNYDAAKADLNTAVTALASIKELTSGKKFALANSHYGLGIIAYNEGKTEDALRHFTEAIKTRPVAYMYSMKCNTLIALGNYDEAAKTYEAGMAFSPKFKKEAKPVCITLKKYGKGPATCD